MDTLMPTTERGPLMPNLRPRLTQLCSTVPMVTVPILMATLDCTTDMPDTTLDTPMPTTTARGPLMLSPRPRLTQLCSTVPTVTVPILMPTLDCTTDMPDTTPDTPMPTTTARGLLMLRLSPRLMPTTDTTATPDLTDTVTDIVAMLAMVATEDTTTDKSQYLKVQSKSSKRTSLLVI